MNQSNDRLYALVMLVVSITYFISSFSLDTDFDPVNEKFYPLVLASILTVLSVILFIFPTDRSNTWPKGKNLVKIIITFIAILIYSLTLHSIGFIVGASLLMAICMWVFAAKKKWIAPVSIITSISFYVIFDRILGLNLPKGLLSFL